MRYINVYSCVSMQLELAIPSETYARVFFSLCAFDVVWLTHFAGAKVVTRYPVVALLVYLGVAYALSVGTVVGEYERSIGWGASVSVLAWGVFNGAMLNVNRQWTTTQAQRDILSGVANGSIACAFATAELSFWIPIGVMALVYVRRPAQEVSDFQTPRLVAAWPVTMWIHMHGKPHQGELAHLAGRFVVKLAGGDACQGVRYVDAVAEAAEAHSQNRGKWKVQLASGGPLPPNLTFAEIVASDDYRRLAATPAT